MNLAENFIPAVHEDLDPTSLVWPSCRQFFIELAEVREITLGRLKRWMFIKLDNLDLIGVLRIKCPLQEEFQVENSLNFFHTCTAIVDKATEIEKFGIGNIRLPEIIWIAR